MKITAFILSILLSTAALAENRANQYSDISTMEMREQIEDAIEDGTATFVEGVEEAVEAIKEKFDRGDITEEQKNSLIHSIYSIEAARATAAPISGLSALSQHVEAGEGECKCPYTIMGYQMRPMSYGAIAGLVVGGVFAVYLAPTVAAAASISLLTANFGPLLVFPVGGAAVGSTLGALVGLIRGDYGTGNDACQQICSLANQPQQ